MGFLSEALGAINIPGEYARGLFGGQPGSRMTGKQMLQSQGFLGEDSGVGGDVAGVAADLVVDPMNLLALGGSKLISYLGKRNEAAKVAPLIRAAEENNAAREAMLKAGSMPEELYRNNQLKGMEWNHGTLSFPFDEFKDEYRQPELWGGKLHYGTDTSPIAMKEMNDYMSQVKAPLWGDQRVKDAAISLAVNKIKNHPSPLTDAKDRLVEAILGVPATGRQFDWSTGVEKALKSAKKELIAGGMSKKPLDSLVSESFPTYRGLPLEAAKAAGAVPRIEKRYPYSAKRFDLDQPLTDDTIQEVLDARRKYGLQTLGESDEVSSEAIKNMREVLGQLSDGGRVNSDLWVAMLTYDRNLSPDDAQNILDLAGYDSWTHGADTHNTAKIGGRYANPDLPGGAHPVRFYEIPEVGVRHGNQLYKRGDYAPLAAPIPIPEESRLARLANLGLAGAMGAYTGQKALYEPARNRSW